MTLQKSTALSVLFVAAATTSLSAATLLATDFTDRIVTGDTASNITWTTDGVADPGNLKVVGTDFNGDPFAATLFTSNNAQDRFAVNLNTENEGLWFVDVDLTTLGDDLNLETFNLDAFSFNNRGVIQNAVREVDVTLEIIRTIDGVSLFSDEKDNVHLNNSNGNGGPFAVSFDVSSVLLDSNTGYTLRVGANSDRRNRGNNAGFDNFALTGAAVAAVPLPAGLPLVLTGLAALAGLRRRS